MTSLSLADTLALIQLEYQEWPALKLTFWQAQTPLEPAGRRLRARAGFLRARQLPDGDFLGNVRTPDRRTRSFPVLASCAQAMCAPIDS